MLVIDGRQLHVNGFNFTWLDIDRSRSFGAITTSPRLVKEAQRLFQADCDRQPYVPSCDRLVVSPETSRTQLNDFLAGAKRQLCIYDPEISDPRMVRVLADRVRAGVDVRIIGKASSRIGVPALRCPAHRLHVRAIIRDGARAFLGSQSLRTLELDKRREIGVLITERAAVRGMLAVFDADWKLASAAAKVSNAAARTAAERDGRRRADRKGRASRARRSLTATLAPAFEPAPRRARVGRTRLSALRLVRADQLLDAMPRRQRVQLRGLAPPLRRRTDGWRRALAGTHHRQRLRE